MLDRKFSYILNLKTNQVVRENPMSWLNFLLMTLFNATVCILLPKVVTLDWSQVWSKVFAVKRPETTHTPEV